MDRYNNVEIEILFLDDEDILTGSVEDNEDPRIDLFG